MTDPLDNGVRHSPPGVPVGVVVVGGDALVIGGLVVDTSAHTAVIDGRVVSLPRKEFALLAVLARNCGHVLAHSSLISHVWGVPGLNKTEALRGLVTQLRKKLGDGPSRPRLVTEAGVGYRLVAPAGSPAAGGREGAGAG